MNKKQAHGIQGAPKGTDGLSIGEYRISQEPYYQPIGKEIEVFYFLGASAESEKTISALLPKMRLDDSRRFLSLLCKALLDREVSIKSNSALHGVKGFSGGAATDGQTLFLPERAANFETFKLMALHQSYSTP